MSLLSIQGGFANIGWTLGSPSVVLTYIAVAHEMPIILAGILTTVRRTGNMIVDIFAGDIAEERSNRTRDIALSDFVPAICFLVAIASIIYGTQLAITISLLAAMLCIGFAFKIQNIIFSDFIGDTLQSDERIRLEYWVMGLGGVGAILFSWPVHRLMLEYQPLSRHSTIILIATTCFCASAFLMVMSRQWLGKRKIVKAANDAQLANRTGGFKGLLARCRRLASTP
ncbi:MAG: hypothetical protein GY789_14440 [Hyphomicrobiales bacterium]|nr:hypothetical protein [Hyphomicrobiales bacterium]MCP4998964.1 hypothetical protein [Hyphomicrobiales bacterium]